LEPGDERCGRRRSGGHFTELAAHGFHVDIQATGDLAPRHPLVVPVTNGIEESHGNHHYSTEPPAEDGSGEPFLVRKGWGVFVTGTRGRFDYHSQAAAGSVATSRRWPVLTRRRAPAAPLATR